MPETKEWIKTNGKSKKVDRVLFKVEWTKNNIPELAENDEVKHEIEEAPEIISIPENERLKDDEDHFVDIEMRGERHYNKCYFRVKDVMNAFKMPNLEKNITDKRYDGYNEIVHYNFFNRKNFDPIEKKTNKKTPKIQIKKELFLTYNGLLRVLFVSKSGRAEKFVNWASETLFTHQYGTNEQKDKLISKMKGVSYEAIQELFNTSARSMPCVYLTSLGYVKDLRSKMNIGNKYDDKDVVYKFGLTKDFNQRKNGHKNEYKELDVEMKLIYFSFIDPLYITQAESELKNVLSDNKIKYMKHDELIVLSTKELKTTKEIYEKLALKYSGHTESFFIEKSKLEMKIKELETVINVNEKEYQIRMNEQKHIFELKEQEYKNKLEVKDILFREQELKYKLKEMELLLAQSKLDNSNNNKSAKKIKK